MPIERQRISNGRSTNGDFVLTVNFCIEHAPFGIRSVKFVSNPSGLDLKDHHQSAATVLFDVVVCRVMRYMAVKQPFARKPGFPNHVVALSRSDVYRVGHVSRTLGQNLAVNCNHLEWP